MTKKIQDSTPPSKQRTGQQGKAIHLYCSWVARELSNQGQTMQDVIKKIQKVEITPTTQNIKEILWHEIQKVLFGTTSTAFLEKAQVDKVYDVMSMFLSKQFGIELPFPNDEQKPTNMKNLEEASHLEYPENNLGESSF